MGPFTRIVADDDEPNPYHDSRGNRIVFLEGKKKKKTKIINGDER